MKRLINWCKRNILMVCALFLTAFIPLYPKLPLVDITQTWVSIRLEDFFVFVSIVLLGIILLRRRQLPKTPLTMPILWYIGIGLVSLINALLFIFPQFSSQLFPHLAVLHFFRRIEYMAVFFLAFEAYRRRPSIRPVIVVSSLTFFLVLCYGVGQKFFGFPAFLTMNEEFAKGIPLRLPATARIPSTFGGHYDLAAYLVFMIPLMGSLVFGMKNILLKILFFLLSLGGFIVLLFTASRISFGVYLLAVSAMLVWQKKPLLIIPVIVASFLILNMTSGASERFYKTFRVSNVIVDLSTGKPIGTLDKLEGTSAVLEEIESPDQESLPKGSGFINIPGSSASASAGQTEETIREVEFTTKDLAKGTGEVATISGSFLIQKALVYDISITTRLQGQWPKAMEAFRRNILLGSGFSSLSLAADGDYHRMLGETGVLGTIAFLGILAYAYRWFFKQKDRLQPLEQSFVIGVFGGLVGLLFNAVLIDVFEASKVAFTLWLILGFAIGLLTVKQEKWGVDYLKFLKTVFLHKTAFAVYLVGIVWFIWGSSLSMYFMGDDFTWLRWSAQSTAGDLIGYFTKSDGFFYRPIPKLWYYSLFSVFWLKPFAYHVASLVLYSTCTLLLYRFLILRKTPRAIAWFTSLFFAMLSVHHENVFWVSGQSSLLAGTSFMASLVFFAESWKAKEKRASLWFTAAIFFLFLSMFCYDGMLLAPLLVVIIAVTTAKKDWRYLFLLLLMPLYWGIRQWTHALPPSGDYAYKWTTFPVNAIANSMTYVASFVLGPSVMDIAFDYRTMLKPYLLQITMLGAGIVCACVIVLVRAKNVLVKHKDIAIWFLVSLLALGSAAGLGGVAERYAFVSSMLFSIGIGGIVTFLWDERWKFGLFTAALLLITVTVWNGMEIQRVAKDWEKASKVSEQSLLQIKKETFPPSDTKNFFFINVPIRYGRAWIFPVGLEDAIWHMFRQSPFTVRSVSSIEEAYEYPLDKGDREVFIFDDYVLKRGVREEVSVPSSGKTAEKESDI